MPGLAEALGKRLRFRSQLANPLANIRVRDGALDGLVTDEIAPAPDAPHRPRAAQGCLSPSLT